MRPLVKSKQVGSKPLTALTNPVARISVEIANVFPELSVTSILYAPIGTLCDSLSPEFVRFELPEAVPDQVYVYGPVPPKTVRVNEPSRTPSGEPHDEM